MLRMAFFLFAFFASTLCALANPLPSNGTVAVVEKRVTHTGRGTWYDPGLGNCGYTDSSSDPVVAIGIGRYGDGGNCNQWIYIENTANGNVAYGQTRDSCQSCSDSDLDMSPDVFQQLASLDVGELTISWNFMPMSWSP
ncbi:RlpA-like double-psi beta-barrel-protein domain-containing protein-containing protein [Phellopilus nigrolimitatus]|nr:RlpA-like double-psi beta-barrel-protein domain-containing protein-containing protein [Phellopilus nigrolimitatus]